MWSPESDNLAWGKINDRPIDDQRKNAMLSSLKRNGLQQVKHDTCIMLPLREEWFSTEPTHEIEGHEIFDLPKLILTEESQLVAKQGCLKLLGGLGRHGGIELQ
jgi:hypothetical protein